MLKNARDAQETGKQIFGLSVPYILDGSDVRANLSEETNIETLGNYDFKNDIVRIFHKRIHSFCKMYGMNFDAAFLHVFCHEVGHSKEVRIFEEAGIFPYRFNVFNFGCHIKIDSQIYDLNSIRIGGRMFYELFMFGIQDYCVNRKIQEFGIRNPLSRTRFLNLPRIQENELTEAQRHELVRRSLLLLPYNIDAYTNGGLTTAEMNVLEEFHEKLVGKKWKLAFSIMKDLEFGAAEKYVSVLCRLFESILDLHVFQRKEKSSSLFARYKIIPKFWKKSSYRVFCVSPKDIGKEAEQMFHWLDSAEK